MNLIVQMKILIISTNRNRFPMPVIPIGACMVAEAATKAGNEVRLLDLMFERSPLNAIAHSLKSFAPDAIGLSVRNIDNNDMQSPAFFAEDLVSIMDTIRRQSRSPVILGGAAVSVMPEELLRFTGADVAVTGDGETVLQTLLERLSENRSLRDVPGISWIEDNRFENNSAPTPTDNYRCSAPDFRNWIHVRAYLSKMTTFPLQTKLGCHFSCIYCTYRKIEGSKYRLSEPGDVADTISRMTAMGFRHIEFVDNVFNSPYDHALSICELLAKIRHTASLQSLEMNPLFVDHRLLNAMERAGFSGIGITVESASDEVLTGLGKGFTAEHVHRAAEVIRGHKIPCMWIFMMGGPNETQETAAETIRFASDHIRPQDAAFFGMGIRIYPGTELESVAREQGVLSLSPREMLRPVFYVSPAVDYMWLRRRVKAAMAKHMNFISSDSIGHPILSAVNRFAHRFGLRPPLWRHTRAIRRGLRLAGMDV